MALPGTLRVPHPVCGVRSCLERICFARQARGHVRGPGADGRRPPEVSRLVSAVARGRLARQGAGLGADLLRQRLVRVRELSLDPEVYASASATNSLNQSIARLPESFDRLYCPSADAVELYTRQCCLRVNARDLAVMGATLADGGVNSVTGSRVIDPGICHCTLAVMLTAGLYETSGGWLYDFGLPAKSGIGGGIVTVSPRTRHGHLCCTARPGRQPRKGPARGQVPVRAARSGPADLAAGATMTASIRGIRAGGRDV